MKAHPCRNGPNGEPCRKARLGQPFDPAVDCRLCWLFAHDPRYNRSWGGDGCITPITGVSASLVKGQAIQVPNRFQLGDAVELALRKVGVTKERVEEWLGRPCSCIERQKRLNELSAWAQQVGQATIATARDWLSRLIGAS